MNICILLYKCAHIVVVCRLSYTVGLYASVAHWLLLLLRANLKKERERERLSSLLTHQEKHLFVCWKNLEEKKRRHESSPPPPPPPPPPPTPVQGRRGARWLGSKNAKTNEYIYIEKNEKQNFFF